MDSSKSESDNELIELAKGVLKNYDIDPEVISVVQGGNIKTVWKVRTKDGVLCLKRLKQSLDKALFSVNAQIYIRESGGNVPAVIRDKNNQPIIRQDGQLFVAYEWIQGTGLDLGNRSDLQNALQGLARFHIHSKGYSAPEGARISSKLGKWPEQYSSMKDKFARWGEIACTRSAAQYDVYLKYADTMVGISEKAMQLLEKSDYRKLVSADSEIPVLCHQDYGKGNAIMTESGVYVIDLDGVTFDLPSRDLRKIIGKNAENRGVWDKDNIKTAVEGYGRVNPMSGKEKEILYIDLMFPHWFYGLVKNLFLNGKSLKASEIERISRLEQSKVPILNALI